MRTTPGLQLSVLGLVALVGSVAYAQDVRVHKNAAPSVSAGEVAQYDRWSVSGALRDDDRPSILGCIFPTESEAVAFAKQWLASNHAVNPPTAWTHLKYVVVEGEATVHKKAALVQSESDRSFRYPTGDSRVDKLLINLYKSLNKTLAVDMCNAIKKKDITVQDTFKRVMKARDTLTQDVSKLAEDDFKKVNGLVKEYNDRLEQYSSQEGGEYFSRVPRLTPFSDEMIRQAIAIRAGEPKQADNSPEPDTLWSKPTAWVRFSARGDATEVNNVSVHFNLVVLYPDGTFTHYKEVSSYFGTLPDERKELSYYYGPDRLAASPYVGGAWTKDGSGKIVFKVEGVNREEKRTTTGPFAYKPERYTNMFPVYWQENRLASQSGKTSEYDYINIDCFETVLGKSAKDGRGADFLEGL